ncbi:MAG: metal-dependent hydrolase [Sphingomonas sp.]|nr:metal-dependent hydrolase [Sphingomonas sp.]
MQRWWANGDPFASAFFNALSVTFPKGEAFFIEAVKAHRDGVPDQLAREIRAFTLQEVMHSREHVAFNSRVVDAGYDVTPLEARVDQILAIANARPPIVRLAATMALEHYTAILAQMILERADLFPETDAESAALWRWHAIEEIEHKGVAYDTWLHATRDWSRGRRWRLKTIMMLVITINFWRHRIEGTLELLRQDGITGWKARAGLARYLLVRPGVLRLIARPWLSFFLPGFHPWNHDDRKLIARFESDYAAAVLPSADRELAAA